MQLQVLFCLSHHTHTLLCISNPSKYTRNQTSSSEYKQRLPKFLAQSGDKTNSEFTKFVTGSLTFIWQRIFRFVAPGNTAKYNDETNNRAYCNGIAGYDVLYNDVCSLCRCLGVCSNFFSLTTKLLFCGPGKKYSKNTVINGDKMNTVQVYSSLNRNTVSPRYNTNIVKHLYTI